MISNFDEIFISRLSSLNYFLDTVFSSNIVKKESDKKRNTNNKIGFWFILTKTI